MKVTHHFVDFDKALDTCQKEKVLTKKEADAVLEFMREGQAEGGGNIWTLYQEALEDNEGTFYGEALRKFYDRLKEYEAKDDEDEPRIMFDVAAWA